MTNHLSQWATRHGVTPAALDELRALLVATIPLPPLATGMAESDIQAACRVEASRRGNILWRNNVGVLVNEQGAPIRFGLANDSAKVNKVCKSSDAIGIKRVLIAQAMVGTVIGQFYCREIKRAGWRYAATEREVAQLRFIELVQSMGGDASFATSVGDL